jgi:hypothetical protein
MPQMLSTHHNYSDAQKSVPVKPARLLPCITIGCCFDSHPRIDSVLQNPTFCYGLWETAMSNEEWITPPEMTKRDPQ